MFWFLVSVESHLCYYPRQIKKQKKTQIFPLILFLKVRYVSDFFKERPPNCTEPDTAEIEHLERKPSPQPPDSQHGNHYNYSGPV